MRAGHAFTSNLLLDPRVHGKAHALVQIPLFGGQLDLLNNFSFGRQFLQHVFFAPTENERSNAAREELAPFIMILLFDWTPKNGVEPEFVPKEARQKKIEQGPQLSEMVFHRRASKAKMVPCLERPGDLGVSRIWILDVLGLIQDHTMKSWSLIRSKCCLRSCPCSTSTFNCGAKRSVSCRQFVMRLVGATTRLG